MSYRASERRRALALYRAGRSLREVEAETGVERSTVYLWCRDAGIVRPLSVAVRAARSRDHGRDYAALRPRALALYRAGMSAARAAEVTGVALSTVTRWCRAAGVLRSRAEGQALRRRRERHADAVAATARLVHGQGLTQAEAAARLGVTAKTVSRRLRHETNPYRAAA